MKKDYFMVEISKDMLKKSLLDIIKSDYKNIIANVIINHLTNTSKGSSQLYLALLGHEPNTKFRVGDVVLIDQSNTPTWKYDVKQLTPGVELINNKVKATIINIDLTKVEDVEVAFEAYAIDYMTKVSATEKTTITYSTDLRFLEPYDDLDLLIN